MQIRKIEMFGFKSFPDRTTIEFGQGISAVIGPNGCGKSNILDAIKWCIGEQSAKSLRGGEMLDVIFAGSETRAPVGFAEVSMTLSAETGEPFPGEYARLTEMQVGRRLHRTGASEYFLNQSRCRRRDIVDLFLDTGVGSDLYCFIEQGSVGKIVHATPQERRGLIEEAAGISRYKARREEAQRRLVATATQLDRAADVADEMERRLRSLENQVIAVGRYRRLRARVRQLEILLALAKYSDLAAERRKLRQAHRETRQLADGAARQVRARSLELEARREELGVVEAALTTWRDEVAELEARHRELQGARSFRERRRDELVAEQERVQAEQKEVLAASEVAAADVTRLGVERDQALEALEVARVEHQTCKARFEQAAATLQAARTDRQARIHAARTAAGDALTAGTRRGREWTEALRESQRRQQFLLRRDADNALADTEHALAEEERRTQAEGNARVSAVEQDETTAHEARLAVAASAREAAWESVAAARAGLDGARGALEQVLGSVRQVETRLEVIDARERAERDREVGDGALKSRLVQAPRLVDLLDPAQRSDPEVVAALGDHLYLPVVDSADAILELARALPADAAARLLLRVSRPLDGLALADDLAAALDHHLREGGAVAVRGTGERIGAEGLVELGSRGERGREAAGRHAERAQLEASLLTIQAEVETYRSTLQLATDKVALRQREAEEADAAVRQIDREGRVAMRTRVETTRLAAAEALRTLREAHAERRRTARDARDERVVELRDRHSEALSEVVHQTQEILAHIRHRGEEAVRLASSGEVLDEREVQDARIALVRAEAGLEVGSERHQRAEAASLAAIRRRDEAVLRNGKLAERLTALETAREENRAALRQGVLDLDKLDASRSESVARLERERARQKELRAEHDQLAEATRLKEVERDEAERTAADLDAKVRDVRVEIEGLRSRMDERYLVSLPGLLDQLDARGRILIETDQTARDDLAVGGRVVPGVPDLRVSGSMLQDFDGISGLVEDLEATRRKLDRLGEVNLVAMEEYDDVKTRHAHLVEQRTDLDDSVSRIRQAIAKMNRTCRRRFRDTFELVDGHFRELYPRLMGGGSAQLSLTDEEDLLETGVDIFVQPPGKRLQNLSLLSGGEKAMTAIAMLLALFQVKPSPFCVLDEVDAPLDEANGTRFNELIVEMASLAQFILITHSRKTMECADTLYGITMPTPGVSRLVSVRVGA